MTDMLPTNGQTVMAEQLTVEVPQRTSGRSIKFTPERIEQIKNLVERGKSREEIAEILDVTLGSLQVTCSKLGVSLRRPRPAVPLLKPKDAAPRKAAPKPEPTPQIDASAPKITASHSVVLILHYGRRQKTIELPEPVVNHLLVEAAFNDRPIGAVIADMLERALAQ
jgi:hypothetical protein